MLLNVGVNVFVLEIIWKNNFLLILCIFNYNYYGKIFMFSVFNFILMIVY